MPNTAVGTKTTITFATSSFTADLLSVSWNQSREMVQASHMATTNEHEFIPVDLVDPGEVTIEIAFDPDDNPPIAAVKEVITVTFPVKVVGNTPANWAGSGFVTAFDLNVPFEDKMTATMTIKMSGTITYTDEVTP